MKKAELLEKLKDVIIQLKDRAEVDFLEKEKGGLWDDFYGNQCALEGNGYGITLCNGLPVENNFRLAKNFSKPQLQDGLQQLEYKLKLQNGVDVSNEYNVLLQVIDSGDVEYCGVVDKEGLAEFMKGVCKENNGADMDGHDFMSSYNFQVNGVEIRNQQDLQRLGVSYGGKILDKNKQMTTG